MPRIAPSALWRRCKSLLVQKNSTPPVCSTLIANIPQACDEPTAWSSLGRSVLFVSEPDVDGIETIVIREAKPIAGNSRFMRLSLSF